MLKKQQKNNPRTTVVSVSGVMACRGGPDSEDAQAFSPVSGAACPGGPPSRAESETRRPKKDETVSRSDDSRTGERRRYVARLLNAQVLLMLPLVLDSRGSMLRNLW